MTYFARVFENKITTVIVADQSFVDGITEMEAAQWVANPPAGKGWNYDPTSEVFYASQPHPSWTLNKETWTWVAPKDKPDDGKHYSWDEPNKEWLELI